MVELCYRARMTRRISLSFLAILGGLAFGAAGSPNAGSATEAPADAAPRAEFPGSAVDLGTVMPSEIQRHDFVVTNAGTAPLLITGVHPSCGCTTTGEWDREIAPGKSGTIPVEFNPANFTGTVTKTVTITTNDPAQPTRVLEFRATVWRPFQVQPTFANFLPVEGERWTETKVVRIVSNAAEPVTLAAPQSSDPRFQAEVKAVKPGREFELHVRYESAEGAAAPSTTITVPTSSKDQPELTITAFAIPQPAVMAVPAMLQVPANATGQNYNHNIVIRNNGRTPLEITEAVATVADVAVKLTEAQPGKLFYVHVGLPKDFRVTPGTAAAVLVRTSHPRFAEIRIPVVQPAAEARAARPEAAAR